MTRTARIQNATNVHEMSDQDDIILCDEDGATLVLLAEQVSENTEREPRN